MASLDPIPSSGNDEQLDLNLLLYIQRIHLPISPRHRLHGRAVSHSDRAQSRPCSTISAQTSFLGSGSHSDEALGLKVRDQSEISGPSLLCQSIVTWVL